MRISNSTPWVVIGGSNGSTNLGDEGMWEATVEELRGVVGAVPVITDSVDGWVPSVDSVTTLPFAHQEFLRWPGVPQSRVAAALRVLGNAGHLGRGLRLAPTAATLALRNRRLAAWHEAVRSAEGVVFAGAGGIADQYAFHGVAGWWAIATLAADVGTPVAFFGQGVGPVVDNAVAEAVTSMLGLANVVNVRDLASLANVRRLVPAVRSNATGDWAIALEPGEGDERRANEVVASYLGQEGASFVAISLHDRRSSRTSQVNEATEAMAQAVVEATERGYQVLLLPNAIGHGRSDDRKILLRVLKGLGRSSTSAAVVEQRLTPQVARAVLGKARAVVSTRYHPLVFALAEGTPAVGLAYDPYYEQKLSGALRWYNEEDRVGPVGLATHLTRNVLCRDAERSARRARTAELRSEIVSVLSRFVTEVRA